MSSVIRRFDRISRSSDVLLLFVIGIHAVLEARRPVGDPARPAPVMILQILSGGQTGVQRAALDAALERNFPCGGWCPQGRKAEDGPLPERYPLQEMASADYARRVRQNGRASDGTLIITRDVPTGRTEFALKAARKQGKPVLVIDLEAIPGPEAAVGKIRDWAAAHFIRRLNVTGPRESRCPGIYEDALAILRRAIMQLKG